MAQFIYRPKLEVTVNGVRRRVYAADDTNGASSPIAQASATFRKADGEIAGGDVIVIRRGYTFPLTQTFEGEVQDDSITYWPNGLSVVAHGYLSRAQYPLGVEGDEVLIDEDTGEPLPLQTWADETDGAIVAALLDLAGVPYATLEEAGVSLGTIEPIALMPEQSPLDLIQQIDTALGYRTFDGPDGLVRRVLFSDVPAGSPSLVLVQGKDMIQGQRDRSASEVRNRAMVTGLPNDAFTPSVKVDSPSAVSPTTGKPYIATPPGYRAYTYQSSILDTEELCEIHAMRMLGELNRLRWSTSFDLARGMPQVRAGQSCYVMADALDFDAGAIFYIDQVSHRSDLTSLRTSVVLKGAFAAEGVNTNQAPVAAFTIQVIREHIQGQGDIYIVLCDASGSTDPDGVVSIAPSTNELGQEVEGYESNGIAFYEWDSTLGVEPYLSDDGMRARFIVDTNPDGETVTLTVYDFQGRDGSLTRTIRVNSTTPALVRDLWLAAGSVLLFSDDGERTWQEVAIAATFVVEMSAYDYTLALDDAGMVYRVETDLTFDTPASAPTNATCAFITWVYPDTKINGDRAWVGTADGRIFFSSDRGLTFTHVATLTGGPSVTSIQESPFAENDIWVTAGNAIWHSYDGATFESIYAHPNAALTAVNHTSGFDVGYAAFRGDPPETPGAEASRIRERFGNFSGDWDRDGTMYNLPAGTYKVAYTHIAVGGETLPSPQATVVVGADQAINIAPITPLPGGAYSIVLYLSETPGSLVLRRLVQISGWSDYAITELPEIDAALPPATNQTLAGVAAPVAAPPATAVAAEVGQQDFPAQPNWITIGSDTPMLMAVGTSPDAEDGMAWWALADAPFTFRRGTYDPLTLGIPVHAIRDGNVPGVAYFAAGEGFGKTTSYFVDDAFLFRPKGVGETPSMIGYGNLHSLVAIGNIMWVGVTGWDGSGKPQNAKINALTDNGFERRADHPCAALATDFNTLPLIHAGLGALITYAHARQNSPAKTIPGGEVNCYRSTDGGYTWVDTGLRWVVWVKSDGAGTVYALCWASDQSQTGAGRGLYRSDDAGATWTNVFSGFPFEVAHTGNIPSDLSVSQTNPLDVMLRQNSVYRSTDGGASWTNVQTGPDQSNFGGGWGGAYSPDGNWYLWKQDFFAQPLRRFAVGGGSLTDVIPLPYGNVYQNFEYATGGAIIAFSTADGVPVVWSEDQGATWATIFDVAQMPAGGDPFYASRPDCNDFIAGDEANGWYWFGNSDYGIAIGQGPPSDTPPTEAYASLQAQLVAAFPDGAYWCVLDGAVRLPGEE